MPGGDLWPGTLGSSTLHCSATDFNKDRSINNYQTLNKHHDVWVVSKIWVKKVAEVRARLSSPRPLRSTPLGADSVILMPHNFYPVGSPGVKWPTPFLLSTSSSCCFPCECLETGIGKGKLRQWIQKVFTTTSEAWESGFICKEVLKWSTLLWSLPLRSSACLLSVEKL